MKCHRCKQNRVSVTDAQENLRRAARMCAARDTTKNREIVAKVKGDYENAKANAAQHLTECEVAA